MLDTQSDTSFITDQTLDAFNVRTEEKVVNISTMNACIPVLCREVDSFKVKGTTVQRKLNCNFSAHVMSYHAIVLTYQQQAFVTSSHISPILLTN